ncbi:MAG: hypothetical protein ACLPX5_09085 [Dissulfurispiraceae bacterium]
MTIEKISKFVSRVADIDRRISPERSTLFECFKAEAFMKAVRWKPMDGLKESPVVVTHMYRYLTKAARIKQALPKSHINDAFVIADGTSVHKRHSAEYFIRQGRKYNRKLGKGTRSHIINTAPKFIHRFQRHDKALWKEIEYFIFVRRMTGCFDFKKLDGAKVSASTRASELTLLESAKKLLMERRRIPLHAGLTA